jgi:hypothetical protein
VPSAVGRQIAMHVGLPGSATVTVGIALAASAVQGIAGLFLGRGIARWHSGGGLGRRWVGSRLPRRGQAGGERPAAGEERADDLQESRVLAEQDGGEA